MLASSELSDMAPVLEQVRERTGITVRATYMGTLDAVDLLAQDKADQAYDAVWLASNDYLRLRPEVRKKVVSETPIMTSPVAIGVRPATVRALGWESGDVTWSQVEQAVRDGELTYGMTDPARSNSGFSTLVSVASALSGAQSALTDADVREAAPRLREFFSGQELTSGSSGWLASAYTRRGTVDALLNYESVLKGIPDLTVIRPTDGVVTADYPLSSSPPPGPPPARTYAASPRPCAPRRSSAPSPSAPSAARSSSPCPPRPAWTPPGGANCPSRPAGPSPRGCWTPTRTSCAARRARCTSWTPPDPCGATGWTG
ncbi:hypothetical protein GCM10020295_29680 [Streptomyces cinereospinus]